MKVMYIQYAGNFSEAFERLIIKNERENYYGQLYSVSRVVEQARKHIDIVVLTMKTEAHRAQLEDNLVSIGLGEGDIDYKKINQEIAVFSPDLVILRTPDHKILKILRTLKIKVFPVLADSFELIPFWKVKSQINKYLLSKELNDGSIQWIANHQLNASRSIENLGVKPQKILPYDWEHPDNPSNWTKQISEDFDSKKISVFFAGTIRAPKGIFDLIDSIKYIKQQGRDIIVRIAGKGEVDKIKSLADTQGVLANIEMLGLVDHDTVLKHMNAADLVIVPSHHAYPEGLPMTIMESLMVRTPVVASDHPMFVGRVGERGSVRFFREKNAQDLAKVIVSACNDADTYKNMSANAQFEWEDLNLELKWADMVDNWILDQNYDFSPYTIEHF